MNLSALVISSNLLTVGRDAKPRLSPPRLPRGIGRRGLALQAPRATGARTAAFRTLRQRPPVKTDLIWQSDLSKKFEMGNTLGEGQQGIVKEAIDRETGKKVAVKIMAKKSPKHAAAVKRMKAEATFLSDAQSCPFAVRLLGAYEDAENVYVVMDVLQGGSLAENLKRAGVLGESQAAEFMFQVFSFLAHTHARGICYGDIKPANFMLTSPVGSGAPCVAKAVDFGCCQKVIPGLRFRVKTGTPLYMAPEVHVCNYGVESDVWSAAVMMFQMLSGKIPFVQCDRRGNVREMGVHLGFNFDGEEWQHISDHAKDLINKLLVRDKTKRLSAKDVLQHPWFAEFRTRYESNIITLKTGDQAPKLAPVA